MNACLSYDDDASLFAFPDLHDAMSMSLSGAGDEVGLGDGREDWDPEDWASEEWDLEGCVPEDCEPEDRDAVERHALRRVTVEAVATRLDAADAVAAANVLIWSAPYLGAELKRSLVRSLRREGRDNAGVALALWRGGDVERKELAALARKELDANRFELTPEAPDDVKILEGPWRRGAPPIERIYQLHVVLLAIRHAALELDEVDEQILELWQEELRSELIARQRELRTAALTPAQNAADAAEQAADTAHLVASVAELWRDTAPAARPLRLPLEQLTRLAWQAARLRTPGRAERAALLIAAGNQRLDELPVQVMEAALYAKVGPGEPALDATWVSGRRPHLAETTYDDPATETLVLRALSGPARTGPRRA